MKVDKADLHRDTKTGLSKVSEDHPGTLGVAKSAKKTYEVVISVESS